MSRLLTRLTTAAALALCLSLQANAHDLWMLPSSTVLSGDNGWITVDAAVGNDKFYFNHAALRLEQLSVQGPDGKPVQPQNAHRGKLRSTFDLNLTQPGTYHVAVVNDGVFARWQENGQPKRYFGPAAGLEAAIPQEAQDLQVSENLSRVETFVTLGKPSDVPLSGKGLALLPVTHPNDLYAGEPATFRLMLDGKPAVDQEVEVVPGGSRYRDRIGEIKLKTHADGQFKVTFPEPGMYWIHAAAKDEKVSVPRATERRLSYSGTFEALQP